MTRPKPVRGKCDTCGRKYSNGHRCRYLIPLKHWTHYPHAEFFLIRCPRCSANTNARETPTEPDRYGTIRTTCNHCNFAGDVVLGAYESPDPVRDTDRKFDRFDSYGT